MALKGNFGWPAERRAVLSGRGEKFFWFYYRYFGVHCRLNSAEEGRKIEEIIFLKKEEIMLCLLAGTATIY